MFLILGISWTPLFAEFEENKVVEQFFHSKKFCSLSTIVSDAYRKKKKKQ